MEKKSLKKERFEARQQKKAAKARKERKLIIIIFSVLILLRVGIMIYTNVHDYVTLKEDDGAFVDRIHKITYIPAPMSYEPYSVITERYAACGSTDFYPIGKGNEKDYLAYGESGVYSLIYNADNPLPSLADFHPNVLYICRDTAESVVATATVKDAKAIAHIVSLITGGEICEASPSVSGVFTLRFASDVYPMLYYCVSYVETDEGAYYYDRNLDRRAMADETLTGYINGDLPEN